MEICFIVIPIVAPPLFTMGVDPIWFAILIALNLQSSFLTPPFGFALFYLRGVAPSNVTTIDIYRGVVPFIVIQMLVVLLVAMMPAAATWLPRLDYP
jgi:TRAP-type mannitol/chloroaromatic compound transport system permease large subunit